MKGLIIVTFCVLYSVQAWNENIGPVHLHTKTGIIPTKSHTPSADDKRATRKAGAFVSFIKVLPQLNPLKLASLGPYNVILQDLNFQGELYLTNIAIHGLNKLSLSGLDVRMNPSRIDFNSSVPQVSVEANFEMKAVLGAQQLNVNGQASGTLQSVALSAAVGPKVTQVQSAQVFQVDSADASASVSNAQLSMNMNQYAEEFRVIVIQFLQSPQQYQSIVDDLLRAVLQAINKELTLVTANEIINYLLGTGNPASLIG